MSTVKLDHKKRLDIEQLRNSDDLFSSSVLKY